MIKNYLNSLFLNYLTVLLKIDENECKNLFHAQLFGLVFFMSAAGDHYLNMKRFWSKFELFWIKCQQSVNMKGC